MYKVLFLFLFSIVSAQYYRFVYEYTMKPDIHKKDSAVTDYMNLDTDGRTSYFYNAAKYERDSVYQEDKSYAKLLSAKTFDQNLGYIIKKDYSGKAIQLYDRFKTANLSVSGLEAPVWNIQKEFRTLHNIYCQKATAQYKGRIWEAWFSKEYPVSDGPYTFTGLPGIVVQIQDSDQDHIFTLTQVKKIPSVFFPASQIR
ncbi:UNVERIFIED_CONTAM: GLPGLI family protein [Pseudacidovorax intermedius]|nr:GLPGLI family protein [Pseudacidovorax intermedius]